MCSDQKPRAPADWRLGLRNVFTNWHQPLPLRTKLRLTARNVWRRARYRASCCGHAGEPGC